MKLKESHLYEKHAKLYPEVKILHIQIDQKNQILEKKNLKGKFPLKLILNSTEYLIP